MIWFYWKVLWYFSLNVKFKIIDVEFNLKLWIIFFFNFSIFNLDKKKFKFYICNFKFNIWIKMLWCFLVKLGYDLWYRKWFVVFFILCWGLFELIKIIFDCVFVVSNIWFVYNVVGCVKGYLGIFWIN